MLFPLSKDSAVKYLSRTEVKEGKAMEEPIKLLKVFNTGNSSSLAQLLMSPLAPIGSLKLTWLNMQ